MLTRDLFFAHLPRRIIVRLLIPWLAILSSMMPTSAASEAKTGQLSDGSRQIGRLPQLEPLEQGESAYQRQQYDTAMEYFGMVAASRNHAYAWLRVGNIWHRRGNAVMALHSYHKAAKAAAISVNQAGVRYRAKMNIALLSLEQANRAIGDVKATSSQASSADWSREITLRLREINQKIDQGSAVQAPRLRQAESPASTPLLRNR